MFARLHIHVHVNPLSKWQNCLRWKSVLIDKDHAHTYLLVSLNSLLSTPFPRIHIMYCLIPMCSHMYCLIPMCSYHVLPCYHVLSSCMNGLNPMCSHHVLPHSHVFLSCTASFPCVHTMYCLIPMCSYHVLTNPHVFIATQHNSCDCHNAKWIAITVPTIVCTCMYM